MSKEDTMIQLADWQNYIDIFIEETNLYTNVNVIRGTIPAKNADLLALDNIVKDIYMQTDSNEIPFIVGTTGEIAEYFNRRQQAQDDVEI